MPKISDIQNTIEKKIDLSPFFGEEAYITIKKIPVYTYKLLLNKNRNGYTAKIYELIEERKVVDDIQELSVDIFMELKNSISLEETEQRMKVEEAVDKDFYSLSILKDKHNFVDDSNDLIMLEGGWFYETYSGLTSLDGLSLNDKIMSEIMMFNNRNIHLGE